MIEVHHFKRMFAYDKKGFVIALIVAFITVYEDPIFGILIGTCISLLLLVEKISRGQCELTLNEDKQMTDKFVGDKVHNFFKQSDTLVYTIKGELVYLNGQAHLSRFEHQFHGYNNVIIKLRSLHLIDMDGIDTLEEIIGLVKSQNKNIYITGVEPMIMDMLNDAEHFQALIKDGKVLPKTSDALRSLGFEVNA